MILKSVNAAWFMSLGGPSNPLKLDKRGLVFVEGVNEDDPTVDSNGAGKSALFEALVWGLYGKTIRPCDADGVVNVKAAKGQGTSVIVSLEADNGTTYTIRRYRKDATFKNRVMLFSYAKGTTVEVNLSRQDNKETDALIVDLLKMDYTTFVNTVFFGQGLVSRFAGMTDREKKEVLERVIGLEDYTRAASLASARAVSAQQEINALEWKVQATSDSIHNWMENSYKPSKAASATWKADHDTDIRRAELDIIGARSP